MNIGVSQQSILLFFAGVAAALAGGGPFNTLIVVNDNSPESLEVGQYYQDARGLPERNIFHVQTTTNTSIGTAAFSNEIRGPVLAYIASAGLSNQVDAIVFARGLPYRVFKGAYSNYEHSSLPSSMFSGFASSPDVYVGGCDLAAGTQHAYYEAERGFSRAGSPGSNRYYLSSFLTSTNLDGVRRLIDRSVAADFSQPTGTVYLMHTPDARHDQWFQFEEADFLARFFAPNQRRSIEDGYLIGVGRTNVVGMTIGQCCSVPFGLNTYMPGAIGEHLTSYGGVLYGEAEFQQPAANQDRALSWLSEGAAGSYGTIVEPCVYTQKFPNARLHYWYARGFNLGESFYMSVRNPYQGIVVGDLLCAPYGVPPTVTVAGLASNQVVGGAVTITVTGSLADAQARLDRIDVYLDGLLARTLTNIGPSTQNQVTVTVNGTPYTHTITAPRDIAGVASNLAALVNADTGVSARAFGDRVELKQRAIGVAGTGITYSASSAIGAGSELTVFASAAGPNFAETSENAIEGVTLGGVAVAGDRVRAVITRLDSVVVTNEAVALTNGTTAMQLLTNLLDVVNADPSLQDASGCRMAYIWNPLLFGYPDPPEAYFVARTNTWRGSLLFLNYSVVTNTGSTLTGPGFSDNFNDDAATLGARGEVFIAAGRNPLTASYSLVTTNLADGPHVLGVVAYDGGGLKTQGRVSIPFNVDNNSLTCTVLRPASGQNILFGSTITNEIAAGGGTITQVTLLVEGKAVATTNFWPLTLTNYGAGVMEVQARADGPSGSVLSPVNYVTIYTDNDGDGASDQWEYKHFGDVTLWSGADDPDGDKVGNADEYRADTQPTNSADYFHATALARSATSASTRVTFASETTRTYRIETSAAVTNNAAWLEVTNLNAGLPGTTTWEDASSGTNAFYRVRAVVP